MEALRTRLAEAEETLRAFRSGTDRSHTEETLRKACSDLEQRVAERTEELHRVQQQLEASHRRYSDLYDFSPLSYFSIDAAGLITDVNLTGALLLGHDKGWLLSKPFREFIVADDRRLFDEHTRAVASTRNRQTCEVRLQQKGGAVFHARLESIDDAKAGAASAFHIHTAVTNITDRIQADEAIRQSEERFRVAQDLSLDAFTILAAVRAEDGTIEDFRWEYANQTAGRYLGHHPGDLVGRRLLQVLPGNKIGSDLFNRYVRVVETGESHDYELEYESDGINGWFRNMAVRLGDGVAVYFLDITERKRAEERLRQQEELYRTLAENSPDFIARHDRQYRHIYVNRKIAELEGRPQEDFAGKSLEEIGMPEEIASEWNAMFSRVFASGKAESFELMMDRPGGNRCLHRTLVPEFGPDGTVHTVLVIGRDITDRKRAEDALRASEARNRNLVDFTPLGMFLTRRNRIEWVNRSAITLFGARVEQDLLDRPPLELFDPFYHGLIQRNVQQLKQGRPVGTHEERIVTFDGRIRDVEVTAVPFPDDRGASILVILNDISLRKQTEAALQQNEARLRVLFEKAGDAIFLLQADGEFAGHILNANQAAADMHGYTVAELKKMSIRDLDTPDDARNVSARIKRMMAGEWIKCEITHRRKDGSVFPVEVSTGLVASGDQKFILGFDRDITERKKAERSVRESREEYLRLFNTVSDGIVLHSLKTSKHRGTVMKANDTICRMLGYTEKELQTRSPDDLILAEDSAVAARDRETLRRQGFYIHNKTLVTKSGQHIPVEISSRVFEDNGVQMTLSVIRDVTERRRTEDLIRHLNQDLRRRVSELETIFNTAPIGLAIVRDPECRYVRRNAAQLRALGVSDDSEIDDHEKDIPFQVFLDGRQLDRDEQPLRRAARGETVTGLILGVKRRDGQTVKLHCSAAPLLDEQGQPCGAAGAFLDVTGLIRAEDEIKKLNKDLNQNVQELRVANRELEAFIYSVSHDLRAPLRSIRGFSEFLAHDYHDSFNERGKGYLDRVIKNTVKMDHLIDDLLHLSRISRQHLQREDIDLSQVVNELVLELRSSAPERQVSFHIQEGLTAQADPRLIRIALENLLNNAWKFTLRTAEPRIAFGLEKKDGRVSYFLRDNGAGFDQKYADKLFLPFHRLHSEQEFEGSGIGLAIVERVIRRHSGSIWAEGRPDAGAVFYFTLQE